MADPLISSSLARGAYKTSKTLVSEKPQGFQDLGAPQEKTEFAALVKDATQGAASTIREADSVAQMGLRGDATTQEVVEAVIAMESTVQIAVSVRDKFVQAYQEIMRMPI